VVGIPDSMKGQLPFAFITLSTPEHPEAAIPDDKLIKQVQNNVREQIGGVAALGGMIQGKGMIPKTRSGKTMRRVLRELLENGVHGEFDKAVTVPPTVEDASVVDVARGKVREYFEQSKGRHQAIEARSKL
jgi:propionyl-CoA synthetase